MTTQFKYGDTAFYEQIAKNRIDIETRAKHSFTDEYSKSLFGGVKKGFDKLFSGFATSDELPINFNSKDNIGMILTEDNLNNTFKNGILPGFDPRKITVNPEKKEKMSADYYKAEMERMVTMMALIEEQRNKMVSDLVDATEKAQGVKNVAFSQEVREYRQKLAEENESILANVKEVARVEGRAQGEAELKKKEKELKEKESKIQFEINNKTREAERKIREAEEKYEEALEKEKLVERIKDENEYLVGKNADLLEDKDVNMEYLCVICMSDTKNCLLEPCNHLAMCISCYNSGNITTCPCCRQKVTSMRKIFM